MNLENNCHESCTKTMVLKANNHFLPNKSTSLMTHCTDVVQTWEHRGLADLWSQKWELKATEET